MSDNFADKLTMKDTLEFPDKVSINTLVNFDSL